MHDEVTQQKIRVLLIDDDEDAYIITRDLFDEFINPHYTLDWHSSFEEGLAALCSDDHDLYLVDYRLGAKTGLELVEQATARGCTKPIILLTGQGDHEVDVAAMKAGASDYLVKGNINAQLLERSMRYALDRAVTLEQLRQSEERYRHIVDSATDIIYRTDAKGNYTYFNPTAVRMLQYSNVELSGTNFLDIVRPDFHSRVKRFFNVQFARKTVESYIEAPVVAKDGTELWFGQNSQLIFDGDSIVGMQAVARDITARKHAEDQLQTYLDELHKSQNLLRERASELLMLNDQLTKSEQELRELNASKDKFFSIISHDLKSPFNSLLGFSEVLATDFDSLSVDEVKQMNVQMHNAASRLFALLENLLHWSRIQTGRMERQPTKFDIYALVEQAVALLSGNAARKEIELIVRVAGATQVYADQNMMHSVVQNLISNAIKFTPRKGTITITGRMLDRFIELSVHDTGVGIPESGLKSLFRIDKTYTTSGTEKEKGTGLGLILCKDLIEKNEGTLAVESVVGAGTTFTFTIPLAERTNGYSEAVHFSSQTETEHTLDPVYV